MKKTIIILIIILGLGIGGSIWWQNFRANTKNQPAQLITYIDRHIPEDIRLRLEGDITRIKEKIGNNRDIKDLNSWIDLGITYYTLGRLEEARETFRTVIEINPINYVSWGDLADTLSEMNDLPGAEAAYRQAIELVDHPVYYEKFAAFLQQHYPERKQSYENLLLAAVQKTGQQPEFIARLTEFYEKEGRLSEAKSHLELLIQLDPENDTAKDDLKRVMDKIAGQTD